MFQTHMIGVDVEESEKLKGLVIRVEDEERQFIT